MAYTNVWNDASPTGAEAANTIDDIFRSVKVDLEQRFIDIFNMANFTADPLRPGGLKFYDTADAKLFFGNNAGTPWGINLRDKADTTTYASLKYTGIVLTPPTLTGASTPFFQLTQTWNNGATTFVGMLVNVTSTASAAASLLFDWQVAGATRWKIDKTGTATLTNSGYSLLNLNGAAGFGAQIFMGEATGGYKAAIMYNVNVGNGLEFYANGTALGNKIGFWSATALAVTGNLSATGSLAVAATSKFYLDGVAASGDTYLQEATANEIRLVAGGSAALFINATGVIAGAAQDFTITATKKFYIDGGSDTYITEASANLFQIVVGGTVGFQVTTTSSRLNGDGIIGATNRFFLDGGSDTYILESSANVIQMFIGGSLGFTLAAGGVSLAQEFAIPSTKKLYLDGGSDTYIYESSANVVKVVAGSVIILSANVNGAGVDTGWFYIQPTAKFYLDGVVDTYITEGADNVIVMVAGASTSGQFRPTSFAIPSTNRLYLDGASDTYIYESSANVVQLFAGGSSMMIWNAGNYVRSVGVDFIVDSTKHLFLDSGGDTYIYEASANNVQIVAGATTVFGFFASGAYVISGLKLFLDSGSNTYLIESSADVISIFAGAVSIAEFGNNAGTKYLRAPYMTPQGVFGTLYDGCIVVDSATPGQFVYFANGARYKVVGTSF